MYTFDDIEQPIIRDIPRYDEISVIKDLVFSSPYDKYLEKQK